MSTIILTDASSDDKIAFNCNVELKQELRERNDKKIASLLASKDDSDKRLLGLLSITRPALPLNPIGKEK